MTRVPPTLEGDTCSICRIVTTRHLFWTLMKKQLMLSQKDQQDFFSFSIAQLLSGLRVLFENEFHGVKTSVLPSQVHNMAVESTHTL